MGTRSWAGRGAAANSSDSPLTSSAIASGELSGYAYRQWSDVLRAIYLAQRNIAAYVALAGQTGLTPQDCLALGALLATRKPNERWRGSSAGLPSTGKVMSAPQPPTTSTASSASC